MGHRLASMVTPKSHRRRAVAILVPMPQLGESVVEGTVQRWLKKEGDEVKKLEPLLEVSTEKVDTEIPAPASGVLLKILVHEGETVEAGTVIAVIGQPGEPLPPDIPKKVDLHAVGAHEVTAAPAGETAAETPPTPPTDGQQEERRRRPRRVSPVVARMAAEYGIDLSKVKGTGKGGRVTKKDLEAYIRQMEAQKAAAKEEAPPWEQPGSGQLFQPSRWEEAPAAPAEAPTAPPPAAPPTPPTPAPAAAEEEVVPLSRMRKAIAEHMVRSVQTSPRAVTWMEADMSRVLAHRERHKEAFARQGVRLTLTPYFILATIAGLKAVPEVNSVWREDAIVLKRRYHIGVAVAVPEGLVVPVIRDADQYSLLGLARKVNEIAERARQGKLLPEELSGSTFTITNHGVFGSLFGMPIINQPNVGILGFGAVQKRVVVIDDAIAIRPMIYLSFAFDHRVLDGANADRFLAVVKKTLEEWPET